MEKFQLDSLPDQLKENIDVFFCSSSFEERCFSIPKSLDYVRIKKAFVCYNADQKGPICDNAVKLKGHFFNGELLEFDSNNPVKILESIHTALSRMEIAAVSTVFIDSTTFTHEALLILFRVLRIVSRKAKIYLGYVGAEDYSHNVKDPEKKWLSKGVGEVRTVLGYPGYLSPVRKNHLIILFGFEVERTQKIIETFEPDLVSIGLTSESQSIKPGHHKINIDRHKRLSDIYPFMQSFEVSLIDPFKTRSQIKVQKGKFLNHNVIIAPMNNKISTIGVALAAEEDKEIQVCYVKANIYNTAGYSKPTSEFYLHEIPALE